MKSPKFFPLHKISVIFFKKTLLKIRYMWRGTFEEFWFLNKLSDKIFCRKIQFTWLFSTVVSHKINITSQKELKKCRLKNKNVPAWIAKMLGWFGSFLVVTNKFNRMRNLQAMLTLAQHIHYIIHQNNSHISKNIAQRSFHYHDLLHIVSDTYAQIYTY